MEVDLSHRNRTGRCFVQGRVLEVGGRGVITNVANTLYILRVQDNLLSSRAIVNCEGRFCFMKSEVTVITFHLFYRFAPELNVWG